MSATQPIHPSQEQIDREVSDIRAIMADAGPLHFARIATMDERVTLALADQVADLRSHVLRLTELRDALVESLDTMGGIPMTDRLAAALDESRTVILWHDARRSDAGRVEVPEPSEEEWREIAARMHATDDLPTFLAGASSYGLWLRSRLSPSPQPATEADPQESHPIGTADSGYFRRELSLLLERMGSADGPWLARYLTRLAAVADNDPQADAVVVTREEWETLYIRLRGIRNLRGKVRSVPVMADLLGGVLRYMSDLDDPRSSTNSAQAQTEKDAPHG